MAEQQHHNYYTHTDIDRYLSGHMSAAEMHELEKAALQDPFLADAIEGYSDSPAAISRQHLEEISGLLQQPAVPSMVVPISRRSYAPWMKIAAAVVVFAATGMIGWYFIQSSQTAAPEKPLAKTDHPIKVEVPPAAPADSIKPAKEAPAPAAAKTSSPSAESVLQSARVKPEPAATEEAAPLANMRRVDAAIAPASAEATMAIRKPDTIIQAARAPITAYRPVEQLVSGSVAGVQVKGSKKSSDDIVVAGYGSSRKRMLAKASIESSSQTYTLEGRVVSTQGAPLANVVVRPSDGSGAVVTDLQGNFRLQSADSTATVYLSSIGYNSSTAQLYAKDVTPIQLAPASQALSGAAIKEMSLGKRGRINSANDKDSTYPAGGWQSFQEYVAKKLNKAVDTTGGDQRFSNGYHEVEMEFLVEKDGRPKDIRVIRSYDERVNEKAIEALKNGPRWIAGGKKKKARVIVRF